ncbi:MAG: ComEC/Rec2 family competence protein [Spirochaetales bacterium]
MKRIINFRPLLVLFLSLILGIYCGYAFLTNNLVISTFGMVFITILLLSIILSFFIKNGVFKFIKLRRIFIALIVVIFSLGASELVLFINGYESKKLEGQEYSILATIDTAPQFSDYGVEIYLSDAVVTKDDVATNLTKRIKLTIYYGGDLEDLNLGAGDKLLFVADIYDYTLIQDGEINTYIYSSNLGYYTSANLNDFTVIDGDPSLDEAIRSSVKELLGAHLSYDNANIAYSVLFGDKTLLDDSIYDSFTSSGIAHLLAVSGLHIGFLVLILLFLLNKLRVNKKLGFVIMFTVLLGYAYLCSFSPSVVRASIMALVLLFASIVGAREDNLSSLSLAGIIILMFNPLALFSVGFLLSFLSVFSIFMLYRPVKRFFDKLKFPDYLGSIITVTLIAQIGTLPVVAHYFNTINLFAIVTNIFALPIFLIAYITLFIAVILTAIVSFFGFVFVVPNLSLTFVYLIGKFISNIGFANIDLFSFGLIASIVYYLTLFVISGFVMLKIKTKSILVGALVVVIILSAVLSNLPASFNYYSVTKIIGVENSAFVTTSHNINYLINVGEGDRYDLNSIEEFLNSKKVNKIDCMVISNYSYEKQTTVIDLIESYDVAKLYIQYTDDNILLYGLMANLPSNTTLTLMENDIDIDESGIMFTSYNASNEGLALKLNISGVNILFAKENLVTSELADFNLLIDASIDALVLSDWTLTIDGTLNSVDYVFVSNNLLDYRPSEVYDTITYGSLQITFNYDTIQLSY